eukprot:313537-Alexandrium_andersonii.AAC.1
MPNPADEALRGGQFEAVPGPTQFKLRAPAATVHARQVKLRRCLIRSQRRRMNCLRIGVDTAAN